MNSSTGLIISIVAMLGFGLSNALAKIPSEKFPFQKTIFLRNFFSSLVLLIGLLFFLRDTTFNALFIFLTFLLSIAGYFSLIFFFKALKVGKVGIVSPIANSSTIITVLLSIIFFKEKLSNLQTIMIFLIILGIIFSSINFRDFKKSHLFDITSGMPFALVTCLLWGAIFFLYKYPVNVIGPVLTALIIEFGGFILSGINLKLAKIKNMRLEKKDILVLFFVAFFASIGSLFFNLGIRVANVSLVSAITFSSPLVVVLFGRIIYKEKLKFVQYLAVGMILVGIVGLSL